MNVFGLVQDFFKHYYANRSSVWLCLNISCAKVHDHLRSNSYTTVCPPEGGDNPRALASVLPPIQDDKPRYNYFIPPSSAQTLLSMKYFVVKFVISGMGANGVSP